MYYFQVGVYMVNIFMRVIVGVTTGMWVWSGKTCVTWRRRVLCCGWRAADDKPAASVAQQTVSIPLIERYPRPAGHPPATHVSSGASHNKYMIHCYPSSADSAAPL